MFGFEYLLPVTLGFVVLVFRTSGDPSPVANRSTAYEQCGSRLAPYTNLEVLASRASSLADGQSAWISGFVTFSPFLAFSGCFQRTLPLGVALVDSHSLLFTCSTYCQENEKEKDYHYMATYSKYCYCLTADLQQKLKAKRCNMNPNEILNPDYINNEDMFMVYNIRAVDGSSSSLYRQCVYVRFHPTKSEVHASSCYTLQEQPVPVNGFICTGSAVLPECNKSECAYETAHTWTEAFNFCSSKTRFLIDSAYTGRITLNQVPNLRENFKYFTGVFRTFSISDKKEEGSHEEGNDADDDERVCLAVTKSNGQLFLDPDNCSVEKRYFCASDRGDESTSSGTKSRVTDSINPSSLPTTRIGGSTTLNNNRDNSVPMYVFIVGAALLAVVVIVIVSVAVHRRRQRKMTKKQLLLNANSEFSADDSTPPENLYSEPSEVDDALEKDSNNTNSSRRTQLQKPNKPARMTLKRQTAVTSYENFSPGSQASKQTNGGRNLSKSRKEIDDYDKISFKPQCKGAPESCDADLHVYDHTSFDAGGEEDYDTMKSVKSQGKVGVSYDRVISKDNRKKSESDNEYDVNTTGGGKKFAFCVMENEDGLESENTGIANTASSGYELSEIQMSEKHKATDQNVTPGDNIGHMDSNNYDHACANTAVRNIHVTGQENVTTATDSEDDGYAEVKVS